MVALLALGLSLATVYVEYRALIDLSMGASPRDFIEHNEVAAHRGVIHGLVGDPWRFRLLSEWGNEVSPSGRPGDRVLKPAVVAFLGFRVLQNSPRSSCSWIYYRRLGSTPSPARSDWGSSPGP